MTLPEAVGILNSQAYRAHADWYIGSSDGETLWADSPTADRYEPALTPFEAIALALAFSWLVPAEIESAARAECGAILEAARQEIQARQAQAEAEQKERIKMRMGLDAAENTRRGAEAKLIAKSLLPPYHNIRTA